MGYVAAAVAIIGAVVGAYSSYQQGQAQEANFKAQANADKYNAAVAEQSAAVKRQQYVAQEEAQRRQAKQVLGEQRAALAQAGIGLSGSAADVYGQSAANAELDALNIRYTGELDARGLLAQGEQYRYGARVNRMNAGSARTGGYLNAASSLLSGASSAYGYYRGAKGAGGTG